jgi:hypothetical protein
VCNQPTLYLLQVAVWNAHAVHDSTGLTMVACMRSHVAVLRFSPFPRDARPPPTASERREVSP